MQHKNRCMVVILLILAALPLAACAQAPASVSVSEKPAQVEAIEGAEFNHVVLTEHAAQRLDIQTAPVREEQIDGTQRKVIPYSAVIYGLRGETWTYTNPEPLTFVRETIIVDYIKDNMAVLVDGPPTGTEVATVGVAELYGIDTGVG